MVKIGKFLRRLGLSTVLVLGIWLLPASSSQGGIIYDNFSDNYLNPMLWWPIIVGTGPTVSETNGRLEVAFPADSSGETLVAGVGSNFTLLGDFDAQVDFTLLTWPAENGFNVSITTGVNFMISRYSYSFFDKEGYLLNHGGTLVSIPATDTSGKLRLKRTGSTMEAFYWQNNAWQSMGAYTDAQFAAETVVGLNADSGNPSRFTGQLVKIGYNNFRVTNRYLGNGLTFLPLILDE